jgi:hypothetical protein
MAKEDLKPFNKIPKGEHIQAARRGGKSKSVAKSEGAKWRHIKERIKKAALKEADGEWLMKQIEDRNAMSAEILLFINDIKKGVHPNQKVALANAQINAARFIHGEKSKVEVSSVNVNIETTVEEVKEHLKKILGGNEDE